MGHSDKSLRKILQSAAHLNLLDNDTAPIKTVFAFQGGGAKSIASAAAAKILLPPVLRAGSVAAMTGTSGAAANVALIAKALNDGSGIEGVAHNLDTYWGKIKSMGALFGVHRTPIDSFLQEEDRWPNIPQSCLDLVSVFSSVNPITRMRLPTAAIKGLIDSTIGNWGPVQQGDTAVYINYIKKNIFKGIEEYQVLTGEAVNAETVARSAGLDELGGHLDLQEFFSPVNWFTNNINQYRDGGYKFNPDLEVMLANHAATDVIVIALHGTDGKAKSRREENLYTDQIHRDLTSMQLDDSSRINIHVVEIKLPGNATSSLNTDPEYLDLLENLGREQAEAQIGTIMDSIGIRSSYQPSARVVADMVEKRELAVF